MRWVVSFGGGVCLFLLAFLRLGWIHRAGLQVKSPVFQLAMDVGFWLPSPHPDPWLAFFLGGTGVLWALAVWQFLQARRARQRFIGLGFPDDVWALEPEGHDVRFPTRAMSLEEQVQALQLLGQSLEQQGRLRAAREAYAQAYELVHDKPGWQHLAQWLWTAQRKVDNRLRSRQRAWWQRWPWWPRGQD